MKIKPRKSTLPNVSNLTFSIKYQKKSSFSFFSTNKQESLKPSQQAKRSLIELGSNARLQEDRGKMSLLIKPTGFIPKNYNSKGNNYYSHRESHTVIKGLQPAKQTQRKFPMRKILLRQSSTSGGFTRKDKFFEFANPENEGVEMFNNSQISRQMLRSYSVMNSSSMSGWRPKRKLQASPNNFVKYDLQNSLRQKLQEKVKTQRYQHSNKNTISQT